jgi:hypothetical protein
MAIASGENCLICLISVKSDYQKADKMVATLLYCLGKYEYDKMYLSHSPMAIESEGTIIMTGSKSVVAVKLVMKYSNTVAYYFLNSRL